MSCNSGCKLSFGKLKFPKFNSFRSKKKITTISGPYNPQYTTYTSSGKQVDLSGYRAKEEMLKKYKNLIRAGAHNVFGRKRSGKKHKRSTKKYKRSFGRKRSGKKSHKKMSKVVFTSPTSGYQYKFDDLPNNIQEVLRKSRR